MCRLQCCFVSPISGGTDHIAGVTRSPLKGNGLSDVMLEFGRRPADTAVRFHGGVQALPAVVSELDWPLQRARQKSRRKVNGRLAGTIQREAERLPSLLCCQPSQAGFAPCA